MNPSHKPTISPHPTPKKTKDTTRGDEIDVGEELSGYGLDGVKVSEQDLMDLVSELIGEEGAGDLVKGFKVPEREKKDVEKKESKEKEVKEEVGKEGHDAVVQELAGKLKDAKLDAGKDKLTAQTKPEPNANPTGGPPEVEKEDNLVTEATPSDAAKATA